mmetsp:Transcript_27337/g.58879  ORF Transcript_27337/g.58879 Transcript_27337/m.58879 type:complete len:212 (+) Transcript_27337:61-696(+)
MRASFTSLAHSSSCNSSSDHSGAGPPSATKSACVGSMDTYAAISDASPRRFSWITWSASLAYAGSASDSAQRPPTTLSCARRSSMMMCRGMRISSSPRFRFRVARTPRKLPSHVASSTPLSVAPCETSHSSNLCHSNGRLLLRLTLSPSTGFARLPNPLAGRAPLELEVARLRFAAITIGDLAGGCVRSTPCETWSRSVTERASCISRTRG